DGLAKAFKLRGERDRTAVAVIGDGALTGGMAWEALNNIAAVKDLPVVIVVNDNGRSYSPTIGGLASHLSSLRVDRRYEDMLEFVKEKIGKDRKSTRLNSSHVKISYAVFCLKKKKK